MSKEAPARHSIGWMRAISYFVCFRSYKASVIKHEYEWAIVHTSILSMYCFLSFFCILIFHMFRIPSIAIKNLLQRINTGFPSGASTNFYDETRVYTRLLCLCIQSDMLTIIKKELQVELEALKTCFDLERLCALLSPANSMEVHQSVYLLLSLSAVCVK